jgi:LysR family transcriptional activator of glutamate synthase operon
MTIRHIQIFVLIAKYLSFQKAARELNITPSSLSKQLKALEDELSVQLFVRSPRSVSLTPAGEELLVYAQSLDNIYNAMRRDLQKHASYQAHPLVIRSIYVTQSYLISDMLATFEQDNHEIRIDVAERSSEEIIAGLDNLSVDIGFIFKEVLPPERYYVTPLYEDNVVVLLNRQHPCASKMHLSLPDVPHTKAIFMAKDRLIYQLIYEQYSKSCNNATIFDADMRLVTISQYIKVMPDYITILPSRMAAELVDEDIVSVPLTDFSPITLAMVKRKEPYSRSAQFFMEYVNHFFKTNSLLNLH